MAEPTPHVLASPSMPLERPPRLTASRRSSPWRDTLRFRRPLARRVGFVLGVAGFLLSLGVWSLAAHREWVPRQFLSSPTEVVTATRDLFVKFDFTKDILISLARVWGAFLLAAVMAIPLGVFMSSFGFVRGLLEPLIDFIRYLPVPALVPLTVIWLGIGESSKVSLLWMGTFFQLVPLVADAAARVPRDYVEVARTLGANDRRLLQRVILPAMLPELVDHLRITLGWCWTYLIIAEIVASNSGIGYVIWTARRYVQTPTVLAGILAMGVIGLATDQALRLVHRVWFRYLR